MTIHPLLTKDDDAPELSAGAVVFVVIHLLNVYTIF